MNRTIDIREESENVVEIIFGNDDCYRAAKLAKGFVGVKFEDEDGSEANAVRYEDIDNMILALQKAKELWT